MSEIVNDFVVQVATINGSGSLSANQILVKSLFRMGVPVGGKNLFPSNIAGLPTWFTVRVNHQGFTGRRLLCDAFVAMNPGTYAEDLPKIKSGGFCFTNSEIKTVIERKDITQIVVPFKELTTSLSDSVKMRKLLANVVYVGILTQLLEVPIEVIDQAIDDQFGDKPKVIESNKKAILVGRNYAQEHLGHINFPYRIRKLDEDKTLGKKLLIDGNTAAGLGSVMGGCTVGAWYPITPSSSLMESFSEICETYRVGKDGKKNFALVQAEDELSAICMVIGAGWAGARAMTASSGPGLSLMAEAAGLSYYAEIPAVVWNVQRVGPSTGLPTRTMQGDVLSCAHLSHGDTRQVLLFPKDPKECFEMGVTAFDLAEVLQTLVIVMTDLDIGMNIHQVDTFQYSNANFKRGKVLDANALEKVQSFARYRDLDMDGIPYRTLPNTLNDKAAYFTRGTGHDDEAKYSEDPAVYEANMNRLVKKWDTARTLVPKPEVNLTAGARTGIVYYGSSAEAMIEIGQKLTEQKTKFSTLRIKAFPFTAEVEKFLKDHDRILLVEQNRDGQMAALLRQDYPQYAGKIQSVLEYDGMPLSAERVLTQFSEKFQEAFQ